MDCPFVREQRVVCVVAPGVPWMRVDGTEIRSGPTRNQIVKIKDIIPTCYHYPDTLTAALGLIFYEFGDHTWYAHRNFRPLQERPKKTNIEVFRRLQTPQIVFRKKKEDA